MNVRIVQVQMVLEDIGATLTGHDCGECSAPMIMAPGFEGEFCWLCKTDELAAKWARRDLAIAISRYENKRLRDSGIILETREAFIL